MKILKKWVTGLIMITFSVMAEVNEVQMVQGTADGYRDYFGSSIDINGSFAVIGAKFVDGIGAGYFFERDMDGTWIKKNRVMPPDGVNNDRFGVSVAISGMHAVIGSCSRDTPSGEGYGAYVFERDILSGEWEYVQKLIGTNTQVSDWFGCKVAIENEYIVVGAPFDDRNANFDGSVFIFEHNASTNLWDEVQKIKASDPARGDFFGDAVAIKNERIFVGAPLKDHGGNTDVGSVYVFDYNTSVSEWKETQKVIADEPHQYDHVGHSVATQDDVLLIGVPGYDDGADFDVGMVLVYEQNATTKTWYQEGNLTASDANKADKFGTSIAIEANRILVGSPEEDDNSSNSNRGAAYLYALDINGSWIETQKLRAKDGVTGDNFGSAVALSNTDAIVGAPIYNGSTDDGAAYIFQELSALLSTDFTNNNSNDLLWHKASTGAIKIMEMNGMTPEANLSVVTSANLNLLPRGIADFTGEGKVDILFHNQNSGNLRIWEMDGTTKIDNIQVLGSSNTNLMIAGVGDFDLDGDTDIATFNTNSGALRMWVMDGTTRVDNVLVLTGANLNLVPRGAGDMNNDGIPDIVLRNNNSGAVRVWTMNADYTRKGNEYVTGSSNTNLELRGVMDIDGDGNNDILNYNTNTGKLRAWLMDGNLSYTENVEIVQDLDLDWSVRN